MIKKIALTALIFVGNLQAVLLKNGSDAQHSSIQTVMYKLKMLYKSGDLGLLAHLDRGADSQDLIIPIERSGCTPEAFIEDITKLQNLGFCDQAGHISAETAAIIRCSMCVGYKGAHRFGPIWARLYSPVSLKNYISPRYWIDRAFAPIK